MVLDARIEGIGYIALKKCENSVNNDKYNNVVMKA